VQNVEESRPIWGLARSILDKPLPIAVRLHVFSDRPVSEKLREIPQDTTSDGVPVTFQIWDVSRLKRVHEARTARDDLVVDFTSFPGGGLRALPVATDGSEYMGYLATIPADALASIYIRYGSRLLEGNVRTFLGRRGKVNKGISETIAKRPERFFAYNNGIAATAAAVKTSLGKDGILLQEATDLQIVNGAQTTASLASHFKQDPGRLSHVHVPMKLSVVAPRVAEEMIPEISRYANSQNKVRESDFFANHPFHRKVEEISRRILAPAVGGSQQQTHWYYERARGQYLNDKAAASKLGVFDRLNPLGQVITKMDLAKVENCFAGKAALVCRGAEKSFVEYAQVMTEAWESESTRLQIGDDWFRAAIGKIILFRAAEKVVSTASWYEGGYRAQIVAHSIAKLAALAKDIGEGEINFSRVWSSQAAGEVLSGQLGKIAQVVATILRDTPTNISEYAKQQACEKRILEAPVAAAKGFEDCVISRAITRSRNVERKREGRVDHDVEAVSKVFTLSKSDWQTILNFGIQRRILHQGDEAAVRRVLRGEVPSTSQVKSLLKLLERAADARTSRAQSDGA
jgi:uncharacterized membrane protein